MPVADRMIGRQGIGSEQVVIQEDVMGRRFWSRSEAGMLLGHEVGHYKDAQGLVVFALPRGGVPVAYEVARALHAPLDILTVRKLGLPDDPELAIGAIAGGGIRVVDEDIIRQFRVSESLLEQTVLAEQAELTRRDHAYRGSFRPMDLMGRTVLLVDDGLATGTTMLAAILAARRRRAECVVVAVPVAAPETCRRLKKVADTVICLWTPGSFKAVGTWYDQFPQLTDSDVRDLIKRTGRDGTVGSLSEPVHIKY